MPDQSINRKFDDFVGDFHLENIIVKKIGWHDQMTAYKENNWKLKSSNISHPLSLIDLALIVFALDSV